MRGTGLKIHPDPEKNFKHTHACIDEFIYQPKCKDSKFFAKKKEKNKTGGGAQRDAITESENHSHLLD